MSPVTSAGVTSRSLYLPAGTWYDFWTGARVSGGTKVTADAPLSRIPLYVRAGSIVPFGPKIQYATESADPLEIRIYRGHDASFTLYEDAGDGYDYENGQFSEIAFTWNDAAGTLTIGERSGHYAGMLDSRSMNLVWVAEDHGAGVEVTTNSDKVVSYDGSSVVVSAP